ncbi:hypothetical protein PROFUN_10938 [Planoprotostelium fungivorum]|uniref:Uncharacterized protein n=1 Tax=Planoprotostelium fungivorum TaxID=1890364 RepID=A0A2P6NC31_9EUKA|nr:hypothetical protein PROFUN_10938 [Planoprotostelium fungivorum]
MAAYVGFSLYIYSDAAVVHLLRLNLQHSPFVPRQISLLKAIHHLEHPTPATEEKKDDKSTDNITPWDADFCKVDQATLFELILAANYLDIKPLLNLRVLGTLIGSSGTRCSLKLNTHRLIPIQAVACAEMKDILECAKDLIEKHLGPPANAEPKKTVRKLASRREWYHLGSIEALISVTFLCDLSVSRKVASS